MAAIAPGMAEVVRFAGGWLFDQVMAGWEVAVLTEEPGNSRPAQILGARSSDLEAALGSTVRFTCLRAIAVRADLYHGDPRVRRLVQDALHDGRAEIRFWGDRWPAGLDATAGPVRHQLSVAARAFKAQALAAADVPAVAGEVAEVFRRAKLKHPSPVPA
jgi:hypothetical protein